MKQQTHIRPARKAELEAVGRLIRAQLPDLVHADTSPELLHAQLPDLLEDGCLILARNEGRTAGVVALDLRDKRVSACYLDPELADAGTPRRLFAAAESRAVEFGLRRLECRIRTPALRFMWSIGFAPVDPEPDPSRPIVVHKDITGLASPWMREVFELHRELGIPEDYGALHRLTMIPDCAGLESIGFDVYDREQWLLPEAASAWRKMRAAAANAGVDLQLVSAFRGLKYQASLIRKKLERGQTIQQILTVSAAPGFSEHHSGRAVDIKAPGDPPLEESFAGTEAYRWLQTNARFFGFHETLGRKNRHGITWEPWHWCFRPRGDAR